VCTGLGTAANHIHKDIYKSAKLALTDRAMPVRAAAAECLLVSSPLQPQFHPEKTLNSTLSSTSSVTLLLSRVTS
jgi:hypothetical protein